MIYTQNMKKNKKHFQSINKYSKSLFIITLNGYMQTSTLIIDFLKELFLKKVRKQMNEILYDFEILNI